MWAGDLAAKRLEILRELVPGVPEIARLRCLTSNQPIVELGDSAWHITLDRGPRYIADGAFRSNHNC